MCLTLTAYACGHHQQHPQTNCCSCKRIEFYDDLCTNPPYGGHNDEHDSAQHQYRIAQIVHTSLQDLIQRQREQRRQWARAIRDNAPSWTVEQQNGTAAALQYLESALEQNKIVLEEVRDFISQKGAEMRAMLGY